MGSGLDSAFTTTHELYCLKPTSTGQDRTQEAGQPHATRMLLTQSLAAHSLWNPRRRRAEPACAPGAAPNPLPGQRRASDLTRRRSAGGLLFTAGPAQPSHGRGQSPWTAAPQ